MAIIEQRKQIIRQLRDNSSLRAHLSDAVLDAYPDAVDIAARETLLEPLTFPLDCPYGIEQILEDDYYPPGA